MVDTTDKARIGQAKFELHKMVDQTTLHNVPVLVVGNKVDVIAHMKEPELIERGIIRLEFRLFGAQQMGSCYDVGVDRRKSGASDRMAHEVQQVRVL